MDIPKMHASPIVSDECVVILALAYITFCVRVVINQNFVFEATKLTLIII